jgi:hypothetical protein
MKLAGVNDTLVGYWMGHKLPEAKAAYLLPPVEKQAEVYMRAYPQLSSQAIEATILKEEATLEAVRKFAEAFRIDPMKIKIEKERELGQTSKRTPLYNGRIGENPAKLRTGYKGKRFKTWVKTGWLTMSLESESSAKILGLYAYNFEKPVSVGVELGTWAVKIVDPPTGERLRILSCVGELPEARPPTPLSRRENALENLVYNGEKRQFLVGEAAKAFSS